MWTLIPNDQKAEKYFSILVLPKIKKMFKKNGTIEISYHKQRSSVYPFESTNFASTITLDDVKNLIIARPKELAYLNLKILKKITTNFSRNRFDDYFKLIRAIKSQKKNRSSLDSYDQDLINDFEKEINAIETLFDYDTIVNNSQTGIGYKFAKLLKQHICTYCNRIYTLTVYKNGKKTGIRPTFDHWFPQSLYPLLTLSYYNLIPSCFFCNSSLKLKTPFNFKEYLHPYLIKNSGFNFCYCPTSDPKLKFIVDVCINDDYKKSYQKKVKNTLEIFAIKEIYESHSPFELKDIMDKFPEYDTSYVENMLDIMKEIQPSEEEMYRCIFGVSLSPINHFHRPFSKMTYDILDQLGLLEKMNLIRHRKRRQLKLVTP
ncbi:hypothetical protein EZS27_021634 [termite gut metagenome]|uniref:HNH nuclease domain-containing protein n=1 Tax=termite gut metagenome TaxID=433724 RepID=A0A5J4R7F5_9ZZZZ